MSSIRSPSKCQGQLDGLPRTDKPLPRAKLSQGEETRKGFGRVSLGWMSQERQCQVVGRLAGWLASRAVRSTVGREQVCAHLRVRHVAARPVVEIWWAAIDRAWNWRATAIRGNGTS